MDKVYESIIQEYFDTTDYETITTLCSYNEAAERNKVFASLSNNLYHDLINKVHDIDFGTIPDSRGDITKIDNYAQLMGCINTMHDIIVEFKQPTKLIDTITLAVRNIDANKDIFMRAFRANVDLPQISYCTMTLAVVSSVSLMITSCVEFIKNPGSEDFEVEFSKVGYAKTKNNMLFTCLEKFNKSVAKGEFEKAMEAAMKAGVKKQINEGVVAAAATAAATATATTAGIALPIAVGVAAGALVIYAIVNIRELIYFFFAARVKASEYFEAQATFLQLNAYKLQATQMNTTEENKAKIISKQLSFAEKLRKLANFFAIKMKEAEVKSSRELKNVPKSKVMDIMTDENESDSLF